MKDRGKFTEQVDEPPYADSEPGVTGHKTQSPDLAAYPSTAFRNRAGGKIAGTPDGGKLVIAITVAMLLGVACGLCLSARLASAAMDATILPAPSQPIVNADRSESAATKSAPEGPEDASAAVNNSTPPADAGKSDGGKESMTAPPRAPAENAKGGRGVSETASRKNAQARAAASPCPLYASASALTVRSGGAAALVLGGPGQQSRVAVTTPDWADIAVFSEGQAGGGGSRGWVKYSVRSVSKKAGLFSVLVKGPCGSLTIPVRVVRP